MLRMLLLGTLAAGFPSSQPGLAQTGERGESSGGRVKYFQLFSGETPLRDGAVVRLDIRRWTIGGGLELERLPMENRGLMIVQLRGGEIATTINGVRQERREDDYWTVPAGASMALETEDDTAILETTVVLLPN